jgi:HTH-type transcriptional regulator, sugar sensing transcriptional regulator
MDIKDVFAQLGLKEDHLKIYLASLEWGETTISNLAYKSKLPRTSIYPLLEELVDKGIITQILRERKKTYLPTDPEYLVTLLQKHKLDVENLIIKMKDSMTQLKSIQNNKPSKPKVHFLEGKDGIKQAYEMSLEAKTEVLVQCYTADYADVVSEEFFDEYFKKFFGSELKSRELITINDEPYAKKWSSKKNLQLLVDFTKIESSIETDLMLFDEKAVFVSFNKENPYALVIEDKSIFAAMKSLYELSWKQAAMDDPRVKRGEKVRVEYEN